MVIGYGSQRPAGPCLLKKPDQPSHQQGSYPRKKEIKGVHKHPGNLERVFRNAKLKSFGLSPPYGLPYPLQKVRHAEGGHKEHEWGTSHKGFKDNKDN